eukprot:TRINITY_DN53966_c0_g1_i2.p2 TRINITY_DN53966_c0_g1~~TRINITY_DN53966_c0_g1_i2.p2  ORF type:complete len:115 (+),score=35.19 TRINITY_DN53966_c0_g1_i2:140-484(+)
MCIRDRNYALDVGVTKELASKKMVDPRFKKTAVRMLDSVAALFLAKLAEAASKDSKEDHLDDSKVVKVLEEMGLEQYVDIYKLALEEVEEAKEESPKKHSRSKSKEKSLSLIHI